MKKLLIVLSTLLLMIAFSCNDNSNLTKEDEIKIDDKGIATLISYIDFNVNQLVESGFKDYKNQNALIKIVTTNNATFEKQFGVLITEGSNSAKRFIEQQSLATIKDAEVSQKLVEFSKTSANENDYLFKLSNLKTEIYSYSINAADKQILMNKIVFIERLVKYMESKAKNAENKKGSSAGINAKADPKNPPATGCNWWCSWGKCTAGILGGAGTGALTFGLGGAAVGTATFPIVGTVSLGAVGAIGGAIAGGLTGAAASC